MSKLVLIDGNAILHRAYHALPPLTTKSGEPINATYGFISMLLRIIQDLKPTHIAVAFDRKEPTFRKKAFKQYQAHRPEMDKDLGVQFKTTKQVIKAFGIAHYSKAGFEADDIIGTFSKKAEKKDFKQIVIVTGDKDILQLVTNKTKVYLPIRGLSESKLMGRRDVYGKLGVYPEQIVDYKALMGDPSDNYPGVYGVGPKTAESLLGKYETFENIYKHIDEIPETTANKLIKGEKSGQISYDLAKIDIKTPVKFDANKMDKWQVDSKETIKLFEEFGFKTLTKRVEKVGKQIKKESQMSLV